MNSADPSEKTNSRNLIFVVGFIFTAILAISNQSLWIDEANTAFKAQQATFLDWWHEMLRTGGSDMQMPLYMIWIWICGKIVGTSEIALRIVNLFWVLPGLFALWHSLARQPRLQLSVLLVVICSPFLWYYLDEARPYAMQVGATLFLVAAILHWSEKEFTPTTNESCWVWGFITALVALSGASMLGMIWAAAAIVAAIFLSSKESLLKLAHGFVFVWVITIAALAALGFYYLWTLHAGARASDVAATDWKNVAFIGYELLGFAGLGPGRLEIRDGGLQVFKPYLFQLAIFAMLVFTLLGFAIRDVLHNYPYPRKKFLGLALITATPAAFILAAGFALHFRVLGRHFAPLFPVTAFLLALGVTNLWRRGAFGKIIVAAFFVLCLASSFSLRFASRHAKDDYRSAALLARGDLARGGKIWWNADANSALYYRLPLTTNSAEADKAFFIVNPSPEFFTKAAPAKFVFCSRPDIYDPHGTLEKFLALNDFKKSAVLPAFVVWEKSPAPGN
jgi:hypothetical protein